MAYDETRECVRAAGCPGWAVSSAGYVRHCDECSALGDEEAVRSARAAGLDVERDGLVLGLPGADPRRRGPRSEAYRATVSANDFLVGILEQLMDLMRLEHLPSALRSSVDYLAIEAAKVQGVSEWVTEDLVRLVEPEDDACAEPRDDSEPDAGA